MSWISGEDADADAAKSEGLQQQKLPRVASADEAERAKCEDAERAKHEDAEGLGNVSLNSKPTTTAAGPLVLSQ
jgi:hypothetical protein